MKYILWRDYGYEGMQGDEFATLTEAQAEKDRALSLNPKERNFFGEPQIMLSPVPQCQNCKHWMKMYADPEQERVFGVWGKCSLSSEADALIMNNCSDCGMHEYLQTAPNFGCIQFEPKE